MNFEDKVFEITVEGEKYKLVPVKREYSDKSLAIALVDLEDGEVFSYLTTKLDGYTSNGQDCAFLDGNSSKTTLKVIEELNLGTPTGKVGFSGFSKYDEYRFDLEKLATEEEVNQYSNGNEQER